MSNIERTARWIRGTCAVPSLLIVACNGCGSPGSAHDGGSTVDTDTDADSDADVDAGFDGGAVAMPCGDDFHLEWESLPQGIDCGTGCTQLTFTAINNLVGWSTSEKYAAFITEYGKTAVAIDLDEKLIAEMNPPMIDNGSLSFGSIDIEGNYLSASIYSVDSMVKKAILFIEVFSNRCSLYLTETEIAEDASGYMDVSVSEEKVTFFHTAPGLSAQKQIKLLDTISSTQKTIATDYTNRFFLCQSDSFLVWSQGPISTSGDIWAHRFSTGETWNVTNHPAEQIFPRIDGSRVVWTDSRNGSGPYWDHADIYMQDLDTGVTTRVTNGDWIQMNPDISGDRVVFEDYRACSDPNNPADFAGVDIWMVDLSTGEERQLTNFPGGEVEPQIVGDKLYYFRQLPGETNSYAVFEQDLNLLELPAADAGK